MHPMYPMRDHGGRTPDRRHHHPRRGHPAAFDGPRSHPRGGRGRAARGDVRAAVLLLVSEQPMHGYQLMQAIADRSGGRWTPSPGAIYPTISQLEDEGLVTVTAESGRKLVTLTDVGREQVEAFRASANPFAGFETGPDLRANLEQLHHAVRQVGRTGREAQRAAAADILEQARRSLYLLLADGEQPTES